MGPEADMSPNMMKIYDDLLKSQQASVVDLGHRTGLSESTVRRALLALEREGLVHRYHGGAYISPQQKGVEPPVVKRAQEFPRQKEAVARQAARFVAEGDCVMLTGGSTVASMCAFLKEIPNLTVVTDSLLVATELMFSPEVKLISLGGILNVGEQCFEGLLSSINVKRLRFSKVFHGIRAINGRDGFLTDDVRQVEFYRECASLASELYILGTSNKFHQEAIAPLFSAGEVDHLITDIGAPKSAVQELEKQGCRVTQVQG